MPDGIRRRGYSLAAAIRARIGLAVGVYVAAAFAVMAVAAASPWLTVPTWAGWAMFAVIPAGLAVLLAAITAGRDRDGPGGDGSAPYT